MQNVCFNWNMDNFELNFLSQGQPESFSLNKFFFTVFQILPGYEFFLVS